MAKLRLTKANRASLGKAGIAMPNGKFPIPDRAHLSAALAYRHRSTEPYGQVVSHIQKRARALGVKLKPSMVASGRSTTLVIPEHWEATFACATKKKARKAIVAAAPPKGPYGRSASLKWPWLYDKLRAKGYDKEKAARISNSRLRFRKKGRLNVLHAKDAHNPRVLSRVAKADKAGQHRTGPQLTGKRK